MIYFGRNVPLRNLKYDSLDDRDNSFDFLQTVLIGVISQGQGQHSICLCSIYILHTQDEFMCHCFIVICSNVQGPFKNICKFNKQIEYMQEQKYVLFANMP